jgi:hypothetical protein
MPTIVFDANDANLVAAIAASLAALASSISVIVSMLALGKTTKQTDVLTEQFKMAELARKEAARPRLTVEVLKYQPPDSGQLRGYITFILRNAGQVGFRLLSLRTQSGNTQNQDVICSIEIHPGYPAEVTANVQPPGSFNPPALKAWFEIATSDGMRHRHAAEWELQASQFVLLKSEMAEK